MVDDEKLEALRDTYRADGKKIVMCHGVYDILHLGHLRHLEYAKKSGDVLIVSITADEFVFKGPGRPVFGEQLRAEMLGGLDCVDYVILSRAPTAIDVIHRIKPDFYVKGKEYEVEEDDISQNIGRERTAVEAGGGEVLFTDDITFSSSNILNLNFEIFSPATKKYLRELREQYSSDQIIEEIRGAGDLKVAVIGDAIIDRYTYCQALGKSAKGSFIAVSRKYSEEYAGGAISVANHIGNFVSEVTLVTGLGGDPPDGNDFGDFIQENVMENVTPEFFMIPGAPTIVKERFLDGDMNKLFEVYTFDDQYLGRDRDDNDIVNWLEDNLADFDLVVVPDYGNGFITDQMIKVIGDKSRYLAVNTQMNSGNQGYHAITRYDKADMVVLNEPELRLGCHDAKAPVAELAGRIRDLLNSEIVSITRGAEGVLSVRKKDDDWVYRVPALAGKVVDRVGAGDAYLSLAAICQAAGLKPELASFIGSVSAALDIQIVGTSDAVEPVQLYKYITSIMK